MTDEQAKVIAALGDWCRGHTTSVNVSITLGQELRQAIIAAADFIVDERSKRPISARLEAIEAKIDQMAQGRGKGSR